MSNPNQLPGSPKDNCHWTGPQGPAEDDTLSDTFIGDTNPHPSNIDPESLPSLPVPSPSPVANTDNVDSGSNPPSPVPSPGRQHSPPFPGPSSALPFLATPDPILFSNTAFQELGDQSSSNSLAIGDLAESSESLPADREQANANIEIEAPWSRTQEMVLTDDTRAVIRERLRARDGVEPTEFDIERAHQHGFRTTDAEVQARRRRYESLERQGLQTHNARLQLRAYLIRPFMENPRNLFNGTRGTVSSDRQTIHQAMVSAKRFIRALRSAELHAENNLIRTTTLYRGAITEISRLLPMVHEWPSQPDNNRSPESLAMSISAVTAAQIHRHILNLALASPEEAIERSADLHRESLRTINRLVIVLEFRLNMSWMGNEPEPS
ncbi:hypothetical protein CcaverHIS641_0602860 [Cutaneotrichosporon cavernicola]|nr:hypothetical protein CcaverHIS641_0602860 [Cutaneotrichosporon cavernicola]